MSLSDIERELTHSKNFRHLTPFMKKVVANRGGGIVNACPFGCLDHELFEHGYCKHLLGFCSCDRDNLPLQTYEPLVPVYDQRGRVMSFNVDGASPQPRLKTDKLVQITNNYRVYRESAAEPEKPTEKPTDKPGEAKKPFAKAS